MESNLSKLPLDFGVMLRSAHKYPQKSFLIIPPQITSLPTITYCDHESPQSQRPTNHDSKEKKLMLVRRCVCVISLSLTFTTLTQNSKLLTYDMAMEISIASQIAARHNFEYYPIM